jgi:hypothetical protein
MGRGGRDCGTGFPWSLRNWFRNGSSAAVNGIADLRRSVGVRNEVPHFWLWVPGSAIAARASVVVAERGGFSVGVPQFGNAEPVSSVVVTGAEGRWRST